MPRGRPKKVQPTETELANKQAGSTYDDFALQFAKQLSQAAGNGAFFNPIWQNDILKGINMSPAMYDREKIEKMLANPGANEDALKDLGQYLYNNIMQFSRLVNYYSTILTFDYFLVPTNADADDMKSDPFKRSLKKSSQWVDRLNPKLNFTNVMKGVMLEDAKFYAVRESNESVTLQEMPAKYCKIIAKTEFGYQYAFNMYYFLRAGININDFHPAFVDYFNDFISNNYNKAQYYYWQALDPVEFPVFKFDDTRAGLTPPLQGVYLDSAEIAAFKKLMRTKTELDVWKILISKIPLLNDGSKTQAKNNFAIDPTVAAQFSSMMQGVLPQGTKSIVTPLDVESIEFNQAANKDNIVGHAQDNFYNASGTSPILMGEKNINGTGLEASKKVDEAFVMPMYRQFERFLNAWLKRKSGRFRFKLIFPDITIFNRQEKMDSYLANAQFGYPKSLLACAMGMTLDDMMSLLSYEDSLDMVDLLKPLMSSHTNVGDEGGRPQKKQGELKDGGVRSRDLESDAKRGK